MTRHDAPLAPPASVPTKPKPIAPAHKLSLADYRALIEQPEYAQLITELHDGELMIMPGPKPLHNFVIVNLIYFLSGFAREKKLGRVLGDNADYELGEAGVYRPDVSFITRGRVKSATEYFNFAPDLAVEVLSPSNITREIQHKIQVYSQYGSRLIWIVSPEDRQVVAYTPQADDSFHVRYFGVDDTLSGGEVLPEFSLKVAQIFEDIEADAE